MVWARVQDLFHIVRGLPERNRLRRLESMESDTEVIRQVLALIRGDTATPGILDIPLGHDRRDPTGRSTVSSRVLHESSHAVVTLHSDTGGDPYVLKRYREVDHWIRETEVLSDHQHPHIATLISAGTDVDGPYATFRFAKGQFETKPNKTCLDLLRPIKILTQAARALEFLHSRGVVHADLKPAHIRVGGPRGAVLIDFGAAVRVGLGVRTDTQVMFRGTPGYSSPELRNDGLVSTATDIWSFGCILYRVASGREAFPGASDMEVFDESSDPSLDLELIHPGGRKLFEDLIRACVATEPAARPTAAALVRRLDEIGLALDVSSSPNDEEQRRFVGRGWELAEVTATLLRARSLSVFGLGGIGKSSIANRIACGLVRQGWTSSRIDVESSGITRGDDILAVVREHWTKSQSTTGHIVVVDNCDSLSAEIPGVVRSAESLPGLRVLLCSRKAITGLTAIPLPGLSMPTSADRGDAVRLLETLLDVPPRYRELQRIARVTAGVPLALEIAAAQCRAGSALPGAAVLTVSDTIDCAYRSLSASGKLLFRSLSVFETGWNKDGAQYVSRAMGIEQASTAMTDLESSGLTQATGRDGKRRRYLDTVRDFASGLQAESEWQRATRAYVEYFHNRVDVWKRWRGSNQVGRAYREAEEEHANLCEVVTLAPDFVDEDAVSKLASRLFGAFLSHNQRHGAVRALKSLRGRVEDSNLRAQVLIQLIEMNSMIRNLDEVVQLIRSVKLEDLSDQNLMRFVYTVGAAAFDSEKYPEAQLFTERCLSLVQDFEQWSKVRPVVFNLARIALFQRKYEAAVGHFRTVFRCNREQRDPMGGAITLLLMADAYRGMGYARRARGLIRIAQRTAEKHDMTKARAGVFEVLGRVHLSQNLLPAASECFQRSLDYWIQVGIGNTNTELRLYLGGTLLLLEDPAGVRHFREGLLFSIQYRDLNAFVIALRFASQLFAVRGNSRLSRSFGRTMEGLESLMKIETEHDRPAPELDWFEPELHRQLRLLLRFAGTSVAAAGVGADLLTNFRTHFPTLQELGL